MIDWLRHLPILPILLPLAAGTAMLFLGESRRTLRAAIALCSTFLQLAAAIALLGMAGGIFPDVWPEGIAVYLLGGWRAPFGIVLVADRLAAVMLALTAVLATASLLYSLARWDRLGVHFHPLFQFLLMGINGAFLTGDLFNLFVFFEVLLAASYGLMLHGSGAPRVKAGLHYIAVNLAASFLFLIGVALIYGVSGTLNMAHLAVRFPQLQGGDRVLCELGTAILGVAFLVKAGAWPLNFWLPAAYGTAAAPVAAVFSITTKVGVYALLRLTALLSEAGTTAPFDTGWLWPIGLATLAFGSVAMLTAQQPQQLTSYSVLVSSGTLLAALGLGDAGMVGPTLFYLISSVLTTGAFFLLSEMIERSRPFGANILAVTFESFGVEEPLDPDRPDEVVGTVIPAAMAFLGLAFISCALLVTGLPPLSGFVAKFWMLSAALGWPSAGTPTASAWVLTAAVLASGLVGIVALSRMGTRIFWGASERIKPRLRVIEAGPVAFLVLLCAALAVQAGPVTDYLGATGNSLYTPRTYIDAVLSASPMGQPVPGAQP
ncbi:monovalent cation/H+ antiporter subunit D [Noviherbaspirillum massiliense]|uniref:monovalent cation/H+ antiporter subunit D n=1 Tax=Noviherbaspirillum massiliense TaxID=1465823 RepID=UPI0002F0F7B1|nr:monovalent cation/H+ antiporter subunit D [Noviherbaspirillum massiliense]